MCSKLSSTVSSVNTECDLTILPLSSLWPVQVKMLIIHRWFDISAAERDLKYKPIVTFDEGFSKTITWLKEDWLPTFKAKHG